MNVLPIGENRMIVASFLSTKHRNVTEDGRTDRRIRSWHTQRWNSFQLFRRAVKMVRSFLCKPFEEKNAHQYQCLLLFIYDRNANGNDVKRATTQTPSGHQSNSGASTGCQKSRDKDKDCWGEFGSRKQFVDIHNC